jgi:hypothetical protein
MSLTADYYLYRMQGMPDFGHPFDVTRSSPTKSTATISMA